MSEKNKKKSIEKSIEKFRGSDSVPATAAKFLLMTLAVGAVVMGAAIVPGLLSLCNDKKYSKKYTKDQLRNAYYNLKKRKLIEIIQEKDGGIKVKLTNKGKKRIREFSFENLKIKKPIRWDKKWRMLIYDIPTKPKRYNKAREALRAKIKEIGFMQLQKSIWVYPFECEDEILLVAEVFQVQKYIEIVTAEKLLHENRMKKHFS